VIARAYRRGSRTRSVYRSTPPPPPPTVIGRPRARRRTAGTPSGPGPSPGGRPKNFMREMNVYDDVVGRRASFVTAAAGV